MRMKIGIIAPPWEQVPPPRYGGTEAVVYDLASRLAENESYEVLLACSSDSRINDPKIRRVGAKVLPALRNQNCKDKHILEWHYTAEALRAMRKEGADIIHNHGGEIVMAFALPEIPMLTTTHNMPT